MKKSMRKKISKKSSGIRKSRRMSGEQARPEISVVVPMYNESELIHEFFGRIVRTLDPLKKSYEIVCVDDGSGDDTRDQIRAAITGNSRIKLVGLSRNFGKDTALTAGLDYASGDIIVSIDADLQDPPELIPQMLEKMREGYDMIYAVRSERIGESFIKKITASLFYGLIRKTASIDIPSNVGDFRIFSRKVLIALQSMREKSRFMKGIFSWVGFRQTGIVYVRSPRFAGKSKWNYWKLWNFALEGITAFSALPLKVWTYLGLVFSFFSFSYAAILVALVFLHGKDVPGYASLMVVILFLGGIQLITLGVLGEYVSRIHEEVKVRPMYIVSEKYGDFSDYS